MGKLNKRQMAILGVMLLAVLYGGYDFLTSGRKSQAVSGGATQTADLNALIGNITAAMTAEAPSPAAAYAAKMAEAQWARDPFYEPVDKREEAMERAAARARQIAALTAELKGKLIYSGYLELGSKKIAVVNGSEYVEGDSLDPEGHLLSGIYPSKIVIYHKGARLKIDIPLQE